MYSEIIDAVVAERNFPANFTEEEENAAQTAAGQPIGNGDLSKRLDCRGRELITIDGDSASDFDDAVGASVLPGGDLLLTAAIADVAAYIPPNSVLDAAAKKRGNSVYLPDRVLPMLPAVLSGGVCSLKPLEERLCVVCEMVVDGAGEITRYRFFRGVMRSAARLNYEDAAAAMENGGGFLPLLAKFSAARRQLREQRQAMILETPEKFCAVDADGNLQIADRPRNIAHWAIEEAMIAANQCAADFLIRGKRPALHRTHNKPAADDIRRLSQTLKPLGISFPPNPSAADFAAALETARQKDEALAAVLIPAVLGALSRAAYAPDENTGHFGLACPRYLHFTSPIRRYPDLLTHRAIIALLEGAPSPFSAGELAEIGAHCSETEVAADKAGWDCRHRLMCADAKSFVGAEYSAYVSGVMGNGFYVTAETGLDGFIRVSSLPGYWRFDEDAKQLSCGGKTIGLGMRVEVRLKSVHPEKGKVDYTFLRAAE